MCSKLYFNYGCVDSAKTLNLLAVAYTYNKQNKFSVLVKVKNGTVQSNSPISHKDADIILNDQLIDRKKLANCSAILVDDAHQLSVEQVEDLRDISIHLDIPVVCFGLRTDIDQKATAGALRLFELADQLSEIKTTCIHCANKAIFNRRAEDGATYIEAVCANCYI